VEWEKIICKRGTARISDPRLLHGSTGPATTTRRTVLPWFVKVHDNMTTMEIPEMGSYAEIALAHQQLTAAPKSPSGHANKYGGVKWAFPGDVNPTYKSAIARAINCQLRWNSPLVLKELRQYFAKLDKEEIWHWIWTVREETKKMVKENWELTKEMERAAYGPDDEAGVPDRSFFSNAGKHPERASNWWEYDGQVEMTTALEELRRSMAESREERSNRAESELPSTPRRDQSRGSTLTPTSQLSNLTDRTRQGGSPMDIDRSGSSAGGGRIDPDELLDHLHGGPLPAGARTRAMSRVEQMRNEAGSSTGSPRARDKGKGRSRD
jgi:hypothetical protein